MYRFKSIMFGKSCKKQKVKKAALKKLKKPCQTRLFGIGCSHAYSRKYSRFARLRLLGFKTPYFRNLPSKNNT